MALYAAFVGPARGLSAHFAAWVFRGYYLVALETAKLSSACAIGHGH